VPPAKQSKVIE